MCDYTFLWFSSRGAQAFIVEIVILLRPISKLYFLSSTWMCFTVNPVDCPLPNSNHFSVCWIVFLLKVWNGFWSPHALHWMTTEHSTVAAKNFKFSCLQFASVIQTIWAEPLIALKKKQANLVEISSRAQKEQRKERRKSRRRWKEKRRGRKSKWRRDERRKVKRKSKGRERCSKERGREQEEKRVEEKEWFRKQRERTIAEREGKEWFQNFWS